MAKRRKSLLSEAKVLTPLLHKKPKNMRHHVEIGLSFIPKHIIRSAWEFSIESESETIPTKFIEKFGDTQPRGIIEVLWNPTTSQYVLNSKFADSTVFNNLMKAIAITSLHLGSLVENLIDSDEDYDYGTDIFELAYSKMVQKFNSDKTWLADKSDK